jgi:hypothetical protein
MGIHLEVLDISKWIDIHPFHINAMPAEPSEYLQFLVQRLIAHLLALIVIIRAIEYIGSTL